MLITCMYCSFYCDTVSECHLNPPSDNRFWPAVLPNDFCGQFQPMHKEGGFCRKGHELTPDNTLYKKNSTSRQCKLCHKIAQETRRGKM